MAARPGAPKAAKAAAPKAARAAAAKPAARRTPGRAQRVPTVDERERHHRGGGGGGWARQLDEVAGRVDAMAHEFELSRSQVLAAVAAATGDPADVIAAADAERQVTRDLGPYLSGNAVRSRAGIGRAGLHARRRAWAIIGVPTDSHTHPILYPTRQFADPGAATVFDGVQQAARILAGGINDPLTIAMWFDTPNPDLGGRTAYQQLRLGRIDRVIEAATRDADRWRQ